MRNGGADAAVDGLIESCAGLRSCAVLDRHGEVLAQSADNDWATESAHLWEAATDEARALPAQIHVATEAGEVYAFRNDAGSVIAVTDRFTLASLMFCDLRAALRRLGGAAG